MRSHVSRLGTLSGMKLPVDLLGELAADAFDLRQVFDARAHHALQASESRQQLLAALGAHAGDALEHRRRAAFGASRPVSGDREAVSLVANLLYQVQPRVIGWKPHRPPPDPQLFEPGPASGPLGDPHESDVGQPHLRQGFPCRAEDRKSTRLNSSHMSISYAV